MLPSNLYIEYKIHSASSGGFIYKLRILSIYKAIKTKTFTELIKRYIEEVIVEVIKGSF